MNTVRRVAKNTASVFIAQILTSVLALVLSVFVARELGEVEFGKYYFALAFVAIFALFIDLGYGTLTIRTISRDKSQAGNYISNVLVIRTLLAAIIFLIIVVSINLLGYPADTKLIVYILALSTLTTAISEIFGIVFQAFQKMEYNAFTKIVLSVLRVSAGLVVLYLGYGVLELTIVILTASLIEFVISYSICTRYFVKPEPRLNLPFFKETIKIAIPLGTLSLIGIINTKFDSVMLSYLIGDAAVGWYAAAYNLTLGFKPIPKLIITAVLPLMYSYSASSKDSLKKLSLKVTKYLFALGLPLAVGINCIAEQVILLCYGTNYSNSVIALKILAWDIFLMFLITPLGGLLLSMSEEKKMNIFYGLSVALNIILNLILIPRYSYVGAASATIASETILVLIYTTFISKAIYKIPIGEIVLKPLVASTIMALTVYYLEVYNLYLAIIAAMVIYFAMLYVLKFLSEEEIALFKNAYQRR